MSGGTKFLATTLLALNLIPGGPGMPQTASAATPASETSYGSRFTGNGQAGPGDAPADGAAPDQNPDRGHAAAADTDTTADDMQMALRRRKINEALIEAAQDDFERVAKLSENKYSRDLDKTGTRLTKYLVRNNPARTGAVYIDPNKFDTGIALGLPAELTTEKILGMSRVTVADAMVTSIADSMKSDDPSKFAAKNAFTQDPSAFFDDYNASPQACVLVPTSAYAPEFQIKGLSYKDNINYINMHEGWHCKNTRFNFDGLPKDVFDSINTGALENSIGNADQMKAISIQNKRESLSDVGAIGDMIRGGHNPNIIAAVAAARYKTPEDYLHWTGSSLEGLRDRINEMGIDKFRSLNDTQARKLYEDVVDKSAFSPGVAEAVLNYRKTSSDEDRAAIRDWKNSFPLMETLMHTAAAVHDGADVKTLDDAIAKAGDAPTKKALTVLRDQINEIGIDRFRALSDDDAAKISTALHEKGGTLTDIGSNAIAYAGASVEDRVKAEGSIADFKRDIPVALAMMKPYGEPPTDAEKAEAKAHPPQPAPLTPAEQAVFNQLSQWDAGKLLQDRAFAKEGKITPATLVHAYGKMQDDLRGELKKHPEDPLLRAKVTKLQQTFITSVQSLDYVDVNAQRGVDIFDKEPGLRTALQTPPAAPAAPKPDDATPDTPQPPTPKASSARRTPAPGA